MSVEAAIEAIETSCETLTEAFGELAGQALPALNGVNSAIGRLTQWKCTIVTSGGDVPVVVPVEVYRDTKPNWLEQIFLGIIPVAEVPHPQAQELKDYAADVFGVVEGNDDVYEARVDDITGTVTSMSAVLIDLLGISAEFAADVARVIPSSAAYIRTSGGLDGWRSPRASDGYQATLSSQDAAASTSSGVMSGLLDNSAALLTHLNASLANWAQLTVDQGQYYEHLLDMVPTELKWSAVKDLVGGLLAVANQLQQDELDKAKNLGTDLTSNIANLLRLAELDRQITMMGETDTDTGWPQPAPMETGGASGQQPASRDELVANAQYFKDHMAFWDDLSLALRGLANQADSIPRLPVMFVRLPQFSADQSHALNQLMTRLGDDVLASGARATAEISSRLGETIRDYLRTEAQNADTATQIIQEILG